MGDDVLCLAIRENWRDHGSASCFRFVRNGLACISYPNDSDCKMAIIFMMNGIVLVVSEGNFNSHKLVSFRNLGVRGAVLVAQNQKHEALLTAVRHPHCLIDMLKVCPGWLGDETVVVLNQLPGPRAMKLFSEKEMKEFWKAFTVRRAIPVGNR